MTTVVVASTSTEDTSWLDSLSTNNTAINHVVYVVDDPESLHRVPMNRGNEAMV
jgi:hypothetical protein